MKVYVADIELFDANGDAIQVVTLALKNYAAALRR